MIVTWYKYVTQGERHEYALHIEIQGGDIGRAAHMYESFGWGKSAACQIRYACSMWGIDCRRFGVKP